MLGSLSGLIVALFWASDQIWPAMRVIDISYVHHTTGWIFDIGSKAGFNKSIEYVRDMRITT
jgi:hypothetical protein